MDVAFLATIDNSIATIQFFISIFFLHFSQVSPQFRVGQPAFLGTYFGNTIAEIPFFSLPLLSHHFSLLSLTFSQSFGNGVAEIRFSPHFPK